jgi:hypothetical protein
LLAALITGCGTSPSQPTEKPRPVITKEPVRFAQRTFDPASPPPDMPPPTPGEAAACDSNFVSNATVAGKTRKTGSAHATVTIAQIKVTLQLDITIWVPTEVTPKIMEHELGHRQISEHYYRTADQLAERIASAYIGKQFEISGADLNIETNKVLQQIAADITAEYNQQLNPGPAQTSYDQITDHSRNDVPVQDAIDQALKTATAESPKRPPPTKPSTGLCSAVLHALTILE